MNKKKILCIIGTRPEAIKFMPVVRQLQKSGKLEPLVVATGQHNELLMQTLKEVEISPDYNLRVMSNNQKPHEVISRINQEISSILSKTEIAAILVQGDTASALAGAIIGYSTNIPVGHIEAGLRTYDLRAPFPEEGFRQMIDRVSRWCFAPTELSAANLYSEKIALDSVYVTGNTVIDSLRLIDHSLHSSDEIINKLGLKIKSKYILMTAHRRENHGKSFEEVAKAISTIATENREIDIIYPVHPNPNVGKPMREALDNYSNIHLINPLGYLEFLSLMKNSHLIISDSGGVQEEASYYSVPVILLRDTTERPEGITAGITSLVGCNAGKIVSCFKKIVKNQITISNTYPYGDGHAADKIVRILHKDLCEN